MYLKVVFEDLGEVPVYLENPGAAEKLAAAVPLESEARVWKEEVYFSTGVDIEGRGVSRIRSGRLAYWPPEKSLCLFAWSNQPYGRVVRLGWFLGPKHYLFDVEDGMKVVVDRLEARGPEAEVAEKLREEGFLAAPRVWEGSPSVVGAFIHNGRVGFEVFVEDYGFIVESDPLYVRDFSAVDESYRRMLKRVLRSRVDVNEEGYVILSAYAASLDDLVQKLKRLVVEYNSAERLMGRAF